MPEDYSKLNEKQVATRIGAKEQILEMLQKEVNKHQSEIATLKKMPHEEPKKPREERITDYKQMTVNELHDKKRALSKEFLKVKGMESELKIKIVAIDKIITDKVRKS